MKNEEPGQETDLAFDQIKLHSDIDVHQPLSSPKPAARREAVEVRKGPDWVLIGVVVLFLCAAGLAGYFYLEHRQLEDQVSQLTQHASEVSSNLTTVASTLEEAKSSIEDKQGALQRTQSTLDQLGKDLKASQKEVASLSEQLEDTTSKLRDTEKKLAEKDETLQARFKELKSTESELNTAKKELDQARSELAQVQSDLATAKTEAKTQKEADTQRIADLESKSRALQADLDSKTSAWESSERKLRADLDARTAEARKYQTQLREESDASRKLIAETGELRRENGDQATSLLNKDRQIRDLKEKITKLEATDFGELVSFSESLKPGEVRFREPLPEGVKIPRKVGKVAMHVLIDEIGNVQKAMIVPGQELEPDLSSALVRTIFKWKFTPPSEKGVRVKAWQPLLVFPE